MRLEHAPSQKPPYALLAAPEGGGSTPEADEEPRRPPRPRGAGAKIGHFVVGLLPFPVALGFQLAFWPGFGPFGLFLFMAAVVFSAWIGGLWAGVASTLATAVVTESCFVPPERSWTPEEPRYILGLTLFFALGIMLSLLHDRFKKANRALAVALAEGRLANDLLRRANDEVARLYEKTRGLDELRTHLFARPSPAEVKPDGAGMPAGAGADRGRSLVEETQPATPQARGDESSDPPPAERPLVLVVEDNLDMSATLCEAVRDEYRVAAAFDGRDGLAKAVELSPDLVITDMMMPGMSGEELLHALRAHPELGRTPVVVLTALADEEARVRLLQAGARDYLTKPFRVEELHARIASALTERRLYDIEHDKRAWLEAVIEQMPDAVKLIDASGRVVALNRAAVALRCVDDGRRDPFGNRVDLDLRTPAGDRVPPEQLPHVRALLHGERVIGEALRVRTPGGDVIPVLASAVAVRSPTGAPLGATAVYRDVSVDAELERLRTEWSGVVAHDLRQPVGVISFAVALCRKAHRGDLEDAEARWLDRIDAAARRLSAMIDELLEATRIDARRLTIAPSAIDVAALAREVCERMADVTAGHPLSVREAGASRRAWADAGRVEQVIANLVSNAAKYGAPGTEIGVGVEGRDDALEVTITNHGRGIDPAEIPRLFQRFARSHESLASDRPGIGLGLYICKGLVEAHGGRIWVESTPGETTSFHFTLPAAAGEPTATP